MRGWVCVWLLVSLPITAWAALGDQEAAVQGDGAALKAAHMRVSTTKGYTVHEMATPTAIVKEFLNGSGVVFAVTWQGLKAPDLSLLMGSYYSDYQFAKKRAGGNYGHGPVTVKGARTVVLRHGHMRDLRGAAYVPELMPPGVTAEDLR